MTLSSIVVVAVPGVPGLRVFRTLFSCPIHPLAALTMAFNLSTLAESNQHYRHCFELLNDSVISLFLTGFASISSIPTFHSPLATFTIVKESFTIRSTTQTSGPVRSLLRTTMIINVPAKDWDQWYLNTTYQKERRNLFLEIFNRGVLKVFCVIILRPIKFSSNRRKLRNLILSLKIAQNWVWTRRNVLNDREYGFFKTIVTETDS